MAELQPPIEPAQPQPASVTPLEPGLEFTPMDTLPLSTGAVGGGHRPASSAPDSLSAPLHFELQPLNFDLDQAGQLPAGQVRAVPLGEAPSFIHDESAPLLDIDLTDLGENELPHVDVPSRFPPVTLRALRDAPRRPSAREMGAIRLLARGASNDEIAVGLGISIKTVESHLRRLFGRYGVLSRTELAMLAVREGWLGTDP